MREIDKILVRLAIALMLIAIAKIVGSALGEIIYQLIS
jgi:hypothetical protein